jgi:hypothetical protein
VSILKDLEKLLQEIAEQQQPPAAGRPPGAQRPLPPRPAPAPPPAARPGAFRPAALASVEVLDAEIVEAEPVPRRTPLASQFDDKSDLNDVSSGSSRFDAELALADKNADERAGTHFHDKFDQRASRMDDPDDKVGAAAGAAFATRIAEMFRNPQAIQQAFILTEILNRPEARW